MIKVSDYIFDFIQTYLENDSSEGPIDTQVESVKTEEELQNEYNVRKYDLSNQINLYRDQLISSG